MDYVCPICGREVAAQEDAPPLYPFCSSRCRMVDLGRWFSQQYSIESAANPPEARESEE